MAVRRVVLVGDRSAGHCFATPDGSSVCEDGMIAAMNKSMAETLHTRADGKATAGLCDFERMPCDGGDEGESALSTPS